MTSNDNERMSERAMRLSDKAIRQRREIETLWRVAFGKWDSELVATPQEWAFMITLYNVTPVE